MQVTEYSFDYTLCQQTNSSSSKLGVSPKPGPDYCFTHSGYDGDPSKLGQPCTCSLMFALNENLDGPVFVYYGIDNFYQNSQYYVGSMSPFQMVGEHPSGTVDECQNFAYNNVTGKPYAPCGMVANSLFNDTFELTFVEPINNGTSNQTVGLLRLPRTRILTEFTLEPT